MMLGSPEPPSLIDVAHSRNSARFPSRDRLDPPAGVEEPDQPGAGSGCARSGPTTLTGVLDSVDTQVMIESLRRLGLAIEQDLVAKTITLTGCGGKLGSSPLTPSHSLGGRGEPAVGNATELWLENSGTSIRFLTAMCCIGHGRFRLDGNTRMRERPIAPLVAALNEAGVDIRCELGTDCPPS